MKSKYALLVLSLAIVTASYSYSNSSDLMPSNETLKTWLSEVSAPKNFTEFVNLKTEVNNKVNEYNRLLNGERAGEKLVGEVVNFKDKLEKIEKANAAIRNSKDKISVWDSEKKSLKDLGNDLNEKIEKYKTEIDELKNIDLENTIPKYTEVEKTGNEINTLIEKLKKVKTERERVMNDFVKDDFDTISESNPTLKKEIEDLKSKISSAKDLETLKSLDNDIRRTNEDLSDYRSKIKLEKEKADKVEKEKADKVEKEKADKVEKEKADKVEKEKADKVEKEKADKEKKETEDKKSVVKTKVPARSQEDIDRLINKAGKLVYEDTSVSDRFGEKFYLDIQNGKLTSKDSSYFDKKSIRSAKLGFTSKVSDDSDLLVGGFVEYTKGDVTHKALGVSAKYNDLLGFVRYRLATDKDVKNKNIDTYVKYVTETYRNGDFYVRPGIGLYTTYSFATKLEENARIKSRFGAAVDGTVRIGHENNGLDLYVQPEVRVAHNKQSIEIDNKSYTTPNIGEKRAGVNVGVSKTFENNFKLGANLHYVRNISDSDRQKGEKGRTIFQISMGYTW